MPRQSDARARMVQSAALLFRERGVQGTSFSDVLEHSGAPRGSIYHHFKGGKTQLAEEATRWAGEFIVAGTVAALAQDDPVAAIGTFEGWWATTLERSGFAAGCVVVAATLEGDREPAARDAARAAFRDWERVLAEALGRRGLPEPRARSVATLVIAAIEGAVVLCRAERSTEPLHRVTGELQHAVGAALAEAAASA